MVDIFIFFTRSKNILDLHYVYVSLFSIRFYSGWCMHFINVQSNKITQCQNKTQRIRKFCRQASKIWRFEISLQYCIFRSMGWGLSSILHFQSWCMITCNNLTEVVTFVYRQKLNYNLAMWLCHIEVSNIRKRLKIFWRRKEDYRYSFWLQKGCTTPILSKEVGKILYSLAKPTVLSKEVVKMQESFA